MINCEFLFSRITDAVIVKLCLLPASSVKADMFSSHMGKSSYCIKISQRIKEVCFLIVFLDVKVAAKKQTVSNLSLSFFFKLLGSMSLAASFHMALKKLDRSGTGPVVIHKCYQV